MSGELEVPDFEAVVEEISRLMQTLPRQIGAKAERHFKGSFESQGFVNNTLIPWKATKSGKRRAFGSASMGILVGTGALKRSIRYMAKRGFVEVTAGGNDVPYARIHNEGGMVTFKITAQSRKFFWFMYYRTGEEMWKGLALTKKESISYQMPKRQFMGESRVLNREIDRLIEKKLKGAENKLFNTKIIRT